MHEDTQDRNPFLRGYGNALSLFPKKRRRQKRFLYGNRDIARLTVAEALGHDWSMVSKSFVTAILATEDERRKQQLTR